MTPWKRCLESLRCFESSLKPSSPTFSSWNQSARCSYGSKELRSPCISDVGTSRWSLNTRRIDCRNFGTRSDRNYSTKDQLASWCLDVSTECNTSTKLKPSNTGNSRQSVWKLVLERTISTVCAQLATFSTDSWKEGWLLHCTTCECARNAETTKRSSCVGCSCMWESTGSDSSSTNGRTAWSVSKSVRRLTLKARSSWSAINWQDKPLRWRHNSLKWDTLLSSSMNSLSLRPRSNDQTCRKA